MELIVEGISDYLDYEDPENVDYDAVITTLKNLGKFLSKQDFDIIRRLLDKDKDRPNTIISNLISTIGVMMLDIILLSGDSRYKNKVISIKDNAKNVLLYLEKPEIWSSSNVFSGHIEVITSVAFNHDGTKIVSAAYDKTVCIWNPNNGELLKTMRGHTDNVNSVAFNHNGTMIVSGSDDKTIRIWNVDGDLIKTLEGHTGGINSSSIQPRWF